MMTRWLAYIRLFDFMPKHIHSHKNGVADGLSRRGRALEDEEEDEDIDEFFEAQLYATRYMSPPSRPVSHIYLMKQNITVKTTHSASILKRWKDLWIRTTKNFGSCGLRPNTSLCGTEYSINGIGNAEVHLSELSAPNSGEGKSSKRFMMILGTKVGMQLF